MTTLDDVIKSAKRANMAEGLMKRFEEDNSTGGESVLRLAKSRGLDKADPQAYGIIEGGYSKFTPGQSRALLEEYMSEDAEKVVEGVEGNLRGVIGLIDRENLNGHLLNSKPIKYKGAGETLKIHEKALRAKGILENEESLAKRAKEYVGEIIARLEGKIPRAILKAIIEADEMNPKTAKVYVHQMASSDIKKLGEMPDEEVRRYVSEGYTSLKGSQRNEVAYQLGRLAAA